MDVRVLFIEFYCLSWLILENLAQYIKLEILLKEYEKKITTVFFPAKALQNTGPLKTQIEMTINNLKNVKRIFTHTKVHSLSLPNT